MCVPYGTVTLDNFYLIFYIDSMVCPEDIEQVTVEAEASERSCYTKPAGGSPVRVSADAPGSRPQSVIERLQAERVMDFSGVLNAGRGDGFVRNRRGPTRQPSQGVRGVHSTDEGGQDKPLRIPRVLVLICLLLVVVSCSFKKNISNEPQQPESANGANSDEIFQAGIASWYGDDFNGKTTANGEIYDMHKLTGAHQTLPFHTIVEVENLENGEKVLVRINDRGPFLKNRIIDLSLQAAQRLAMTDKGTAAVNLRVLHWSGAPLTIASAIADNAGAECCIQAGAFAIRENADDLLLTLAEIFPDLQFRIIVEDDMFKVLSEKLPTTRGCQEIIDKMAEYHLQGFIRAL